MHLVSFSNKFIMAVLNQKLANLAELFLQHVSSLHQLFINDKVDVSINVCKLLLSGGNFFIAFSRL